MTHETTINDLKLWLAEIDTKMSEKIDTSVPDNVLGKLGELSPLLALSAQTVSLSEKVYAQRIGELVLMKEYRNLSATEKKMLFASLAAEEQELFTRASRLNAGLTHSIDAYRSALSWLKSEMQNLSFHHNK